MNTRATSVDELADPSVEAAGFATPVPLSNGDVRPPLRLQEPISPHQAPLLERLTSRDEATVEDDLNEDLGYPTLGDEHSNWLDRATDRE